MQKLQCAVWNSVSHFIVILIYTNCFPVCAHAFDEHGSDSLRACSHYLRPSVESDLIGCSRRLQRLVPCTSNTPSVIRQRTHVV